MKQHLSAKTLEDHDLHFSVLVFHKQLMQVDITLYSERGKSDLTLSTNIDCLDRVNYCVNYCNNYMIVILYNTSTEQRRPMNRGDINCQSCVFICM